MISELRHFGRVVKATDLNEAQCDTEPYPSSISVSFVSAGSNPAGVELLFGGPINMILDCLQRGAGVGLVGLLDLPQPCK